MNQHFLDYLSSTVLKENISSYTSLSGGDISQAYVLTTQNERFVIKTNTKSDASIMFSAEQNGLLEIAQTNTIQVPDVLATGEYENEAFILMEYVESKRATYADMERFGHQLAALHQVSHTHFGWTQNNYIGSLDQSNALFDDWVSFYVQERLLPQIKLAQRSGYLDDTISESQLLKGCERLLPKCTPSLLHGDLWSGNYLISSEGKPYLIDPATYYGHHEVDLAMTRLFGSFGNHFYETYHESIPLTEGHHDRNDIYQLYYLLVHLNLFGRGYYHAVSGILKRYF